MTLSSPNHRQSPHRSKPFYGRFKSTRTRSGCLCCRQRKVKCDESRPSCKRCSDARRPCVYGLKLTWPDQKKAVKVEKPDEAIVGRIPADYQAEALFINTTWSDFELSHGQGAPRATKKVAHYSDGLSLRTESDWSKELQLPVSISCPGIDLSATEMPIFNFYVNQMCPECRLVDGDRNRYRQVIIPISLVSPLVLRSVLALAANQLKHYDNRYKVTALRYQSATLQSLSQTIATASSSKDQTRQPAPLSHALLSKTEMLAIVLMLCHSEFSNDIAYRPRSAPAWRAHLDGARRILELPSHGPSVELSGVVTFLAGFLASHSVLAYTTLVNPGDAEALLRGGTYWLDKIARLPQEIDNYTNCSTELLSIILEICHLIRQRTHHKTPDECEQLHAWKKETQSRLLHLVQFHASSFQTSSPVSITTLSNPITAYPPPIPTVNRTAEAFRHAALILLQYLDLSWPVERNPIVKESVSIVLSLMNAGVPIPPPGKSGRSVFLWPYFIAACHVQSDDDRAVVLRNLQELERIAATVFNNAVTFIREVIEGVWKQRDLKDDRAKSGVGSSGGCFCIPARNDEDNDKDMPCFEWERVMSSLGYTFDWA